MSTGDINLANNIVRVQVHIRGRRPLLQHHFTPEALSKEKKERNGPPGNEPDEWKKTCMVTKKNQLYIPGTYVFGMLRDAAKYTKKGKGSLQALMAATLQVEDDVLLLDRFLPKSGPDNDKQAPVYIDVCGVRNPSTKGRNVRYRLAASPGWNLTFTILWDKTIISRDEMRAVLNDAGTLTGLADGRNIGYGRFDVVSFQELDAKEKNAA